MTRNGPLNDLESQRTVAQLLAPTDDGFVVNANYTWSHTLDEISNGSLPSSTTALQGQINPAQPQTITTAMPTTMRDTALTRTMCGPSRSTSRTGR